MPCIGINVDIVSVLLCQFVLSWEAFTGYAPEFKLRERLDNLFREGYKP